MADSIARKELELKMVVTADASRGSAAVKALAAEVERAEKLATGAGKAIDGMGVGANRGAAGRGGAGGPVPVVVVGGTHTGAAGGGATKFPSGDDKAEGGNLDFLAGAAKVAAAAAAAAGVVQIVGNLTKAVQSLDSEFLTVREKALGFAQALPVVGDSFAKLLGNMMDTSERLFDEDRAKRVDRLRYEVPMQMARDQARSQYDMRALGLRRETAEAGFRAQAVGEFPTLASGDAIARLMLGSLHPAAGFAQQAVAESIDPRLEAAQEAVRSARRDARAAELSAGASEKDVEDARPGAARAMAEFRARAGDSREAMAAAMDPDSHRVKGARTSADSAYAAMKGTRLEGTLAGDAAAGFFGLGGFLSPTTVGVTDKGSGLALAEAELRERKATADATRAVADLESRITTNKERQLQLAQRQHDVAKAESALLKTQVGIYDEKIARARSGERQFGATDVVGQDALLRSLQRFQKYGREGIGEDEIGMLQGSALTSEFVGRQLEKDARGSGLLKQIREITGEKDSAELKTERDKLKTELDIKIQLDEEKFSQLIAEKMKNLNLKDLLGEIVKNQLEVAMRKPEADFLRGKVERGGP